MYNLKKDIKGDIKYKDLREIILPGVTARKGNGWKRKLREIKKYHIKRFTLFIEEIPIKKRKKLYKYLSKMEIEEIPLVHIRKDTTKEELEFFRKNYKTKYFTIHEDHFLDLNKWKGFHKDLYVEFNNDNFVSKEVKVEKIGGFCIDLSHFKREETSKSKEFYYITKRKKIKKYFACNHLNGYSYKKNKDIHYPLKLKQFEYLKELPNYLFGKVIALEMYNSIKQQLKDKEYLINLLSRKLKGNI